MSARVALTRAGTLLLVAFVELVPTVDEDVVLSERLVTNQIAPTTTTIITTAIADAIDLRRARV
ncbi:hypothetical protein GOEFS_036_00360 [Gordonia effusa NBRC 100432]|uniref:Uncharacterized protein n=1 Tax=Gordonia effusa NBRC 100432 TaxID=1077974 RepID=H0QXP6_9ACTN|nr:hypothetical protein GOEFS_036_00360 [Gordonia effusa NBRC 100432]